MAKVIHFDVGHSITIMDGFDADKPSFSMRVELEDGDDLYVEVAKAIKTVNGIMLLIPDSGLPKE